MNPDARDGLLVLDKGGGVTSRDAVNAALRWFPRGTRIGHTGTLDPLATGVLVLCLGAATRLTEYVQRMGKTYRAGVRLGARSDTDDADGMVTTVNAAAPDAATVTACLAGFVGDIEQTPPAYSAAKVAGRAPTTSPARDRTWTCGRAASTSTASTCVAMIIRIWSWKCVAARGRTSVRWPATSAPGSAAAR